MTGKANPRMLSIDSILFTTIARDYDRDAQLYEGSVVTRDLWFEYHPFIYLILKTFSANGSASKRLKMAANVTLNPIKMATECVLK